MLYLSLETSNELFIVTNDILTAEDPIYLFRFYNEQTKNEYFTELENLTPDNSRYDKYILILPTDVDLPVGKYRYQVYASEEAGDHDYEEMERLAEGAAEVVASFEEDVVFVPTGEDKVYE